MPILIASDIAAIYFVSQSSEQAKEPEMVKYVWHISLSGLVGNTFVLLTSFRSNIFGTIVIALLIFLFVMLYQFIVFCLSFNILMKRRVIEEDSSRELLYTSPTA